MKYCESCEIRCSSHERLCPLCDAELVSLQTNTEAILNNAERRYPLPEMKRAQYNLLGRVYIFLCILICMISIVLDTFFYEGSMWSILSIGSVAYSWTLMYHALRSNRHIASKIVVQALAGSILIVLIDIMTGFQGWSVNFVVPQIAILANVVIFILMIANRMVWREFVMYQLAMAGLSFIPLALIVLNIVTRPFISLIAVFIAALILLGTATFGDKTVKSELIRRFHI